MAVEKVGGTYVIKASPVKAGTTSTGQSWANLVTQQKYQLWKIANAEAARRIKFEQMDAQRRQQVVDQMRRDLMNQQEQTRTQIANLKQLQVEDVAKQQAELARETNLRGRPERRTTGSGGGGGYSGQRYNLIQEGARLQTTAAQAEDQVEQLRDQLIDAGADETVLTDWSQGKNISENERKIIERLGDVGKNQLQALEGAQDRARFAREEYNLFSTSDIPGKHKFVQDRLSGGAGGGFGGGGSRTYYTKGEPIVSAPVADREPAIKELQDRLRELERQQLELQDVSIPVGDEIRTTRQILGSKFGEGTQRLPEQPMAQPAPAPVQQQAQDFSNVRSVEREALELEAAPAAQPQAARQQPVQQQVQETVAEPRITPEVEAAPTEQAQEEVVEEPGVSISDLAAMAYGGQPTAYDKAMARYKQPMGTAQRYEDVYIPPADTPMDEALGRMEERYFGDDIEFQPGTFERPEFPTFRPGTAEVQEFPTFRPGTAEVQEFPTFRPGTAEVQEFPILKPSTAVPQTQADINRNVLQQMRQAEIETLQGLVQEAVPKPSPFREVKAVMDEASKTFNNADLQIAGLQMLQDYAYLQQTDPEEYYKIKDVVTTAVAKRLNVREYQIQQAAKTLTKVNQVTPQKLANTVRGATVKDAELVIQLTGALFDDVASIESAYENARQQINTFADKGGLSEDQRTQMLTLLENYKAYKTLVVER